MEMNQGPSGPPPIPPQPQQRSEEPPPFTPPRKKKNKTVKVILGLLFIVGLGLFSLIGLLSVFAFFPTDSIDLNTSFGDSVAVMDIEGTIMDPTLFRDQIERLHGDSSIEAVVVRIESPGGAVGTSQENFRGTQKTTG